MFDNKWQKKEMPLVSLIGMGGGIASPAFLASIVLNILKPTVFSPADNTGAPDFDYTAESSAITNIGTVDVLGDVGFSSDIWTGDGDSNGQKITTGVDLLTDGGMVWIKARDRSSGDVYSRHFIWDTERGSTNTSFLSPDVEDAEGQSGGKGGKIGILSDGFTAGGPGAQNNETYVGWSFRRAPGFFDIVTWTGDGSGTRDINHSLGSAPALMIWKKVNTTSDWSVYHKDLGLGHGLYLNTASNKNDTSLWGTGPTTTNFPAHTAFNLVGEEYVAYLFADNPSNQIECGTYTGTGTDQTTNSASTSTSLDFDPEWLLVKNIDSNDSDWCIVDTTRGSLNQLVTNDNRAESNTIPHGLALFGGHFQAYGSSVDHNKSGDNYIYMAIGSPRETVSATQLTLTDTTVSKISNGSLVSGTSIDQVLTVGETVQADTVAAGTVSIPVFDSHLYTGTGNSTTITNGIDLAGEGGMVWIKWTSGGAYSVESHCLIDTERSSGSASDTYGTFTPFLRPNQEVAKQNAYYLNFNSDGYEINTPSSLVNHDSGGQYVNWTFGKAPGFFDIVKWNASDLTGVYGTDYLINHNLGTIPGMIICKNINNTSGAPWYVYHKDAISSSSSDPNAHFFYLNETREAIYSSGMSNSSMDGWAVTDTHFRAAPSLGLDNGSDDFIAYVFAGDTPGLIKCGSYTGAGASTQVNVGFQPRWMMIKRADSSGNWVILDEDMDDHTYLKANSDDPQGGVAWNFTATGVTLVGEWGSLNNSGGEYTYIAISENAEADIPRDIYATGEVSASSGNTITLSNTTGTWSTGMKIQGATTDTKDNPDPISAQNVSLTSSAPTAEKNVNTWGDAVWEIATDENFTQNIQTATTALSATGTQTGPSFTFEPETGYYARTKYTALGQESEWSDVNYFVTKLVYVDSFWINLFNSNGWDYEYTENIDSDDNGNVYIVSIRYSAGGSGYKGMSLVKLDANGILQWQKYLTYNIPGDRTYPLESRTVSVTPDGSEIFVTAQGDLGMLICQFNSDGVLQWTQKLGGSNSNSFSYGTTLTSSGELVMFGRDYQNPGRHTFVTQISNSGSQTFYSSIGRTSGDTTELAYTCIPFVDTDDNIHFVINSWNGSKRTPGVVKYNSSGVLQSVSDFNSTVDNSIADEDHFGDISVDGSGNKYITYRRDVSGMRSGLLKLNSSDEIQWQSDISSSNAHYPLQVNIDSSGDIVSAFEDRRTNKGIIITKHTSDGTLVWKRSFRHQSDEIWTGAVVRLNRNDNILLNSFVKGVVKTFTCQLPRDGALMGSYNNFIWEDATHVTVSSSTAYFKNGSSIYSAKSTSLSMSPFSDTSTGNNILTVNKTDIPTP